MIILKTETFCCCFTSHQVLPWQQLSRLTSTQTTIKHKCGRMMRLTKMSPDVSHPHMNVMTLMNSSLSLLQASLITEYAAVVQPIQMAFQQQIQALKNQHEEFVTSLKQQQPPTATVPQIPAPSETEKAPPMTTPAGEKTETCQRQSTVSQCAGHSVDITCVGMCVLFRGCETPHGRSSRGI